MQQILLFIITSVLLIIPSALARDESPSSSSNPNPHNCTGIGADYTGNVSVTKSGTPCQIWPSFYANQYRQKHLTKHNYCRNPTFSLKGPYCVVQLLGGLFGMEKIEHCDIKCEPGFILETFDKRCESRSVTNLIEFDNVTMESCIRHCAAIIGCVRAVYGRKYCGQCPKDAVLEDATDYMILKYYNAGVNHRCQLMENDRDNEAINKDMCSDEHGAITAHDCHLVCARGYGGTVDVECGERKKWFDVMTICKLPPENQLPSKYSYNFCQAHQEHIPADRCRVRCKRSGEWATVTCNVATGLFSLAGHCEEILCDFTQKDETIFDVSQCRTGFGAAKADGCRFPCFGEKSGNIRSNCVEQNILNFEFHCDRLLKRELIQVPEPQIPSPEPSQTEALSPTPPPSVAPLKCHVHSDMQTSTRFNFNGCDAFRTPILAADCTVICSFTNVALPIQCSTSGYFFTTEDCLPRLCSATITHNSRFDLTHCDTTKHALYAHNCDARCREGDGFVQVRCHSDGGIFEMQDMCDLRKMQSEYQDVAIQTEEEEGTRISNEKA